jgi:ubiquinone/menaquinone biosynthesis C-methylase UbiE
MSFAELFDRVAEAAGRQLAHPSGVGGRIASAVMHVANRRPTQLLFGKLDIRPNHRVLDVGCGNGAALAALPDVRWRCGVDQSQTMLEIARRRLRRNIDQGCAHLCWGDMLALPFSANSFDRIIASNVLYFCSDIPAFIDECRRVARRGALLGIYVTSAASMEKWRFAGPATHRHFSQHAIEIELEKSNVDQESRSITQLALPGGVEGLIAVVRLK